MPRIRLPISFLLLLLFLVLLGRSYLEAKGRAQRLELLQTEVDTLGDKKEELEEDLGYHQSSDYIEKEAREQLGYVKDGEVIVVLPDLEEQVTALAEKGDEATSPTASLAGSEIPNWRRWRQLFFGN
jgi:cell division protein FtsB